MGIEDDDIRRVRDATDIVQLITGYTQLRRVGRRWSGLCPFHTEKTGSFSVNGEEGLYYCFGCQKKGDAITFVREMEHLDFVGAVEHLAAKSGIQLRYTKQNEGADRRRRTELTDAVEKAVEWYHERLLSSADAGPARGYLRNRGLGREEVDKYKIGWAPDGWDHLANALRLPPKVFGDSGLGFVNRRGRLQDHFRGRVLFPIFDANSAAVGFGGRIMPGGEGPKYKNSGESSIYAKSRLLYGLNWAKDPIVRADEVIICEGYTDVIGFDQAGIGRAVATCGTALTEDHIRLLSRFAKRIVLAFDADAAGQAAAERIYEWEQAYEMDVGVARLAEGVDPADLALEDPEALAKAVDEAEPFMGFRLGRVFGAAELGTPEGRARAAQRSVDVIREHPDALVRDSYLMEVAGRTRSDEDRLRQMLAAPPQTQPDQRTQRQAPAREYDDSQAPAMPPFVVTDNTETQVLRLAIHRPDQIPPYLNEGFFSDARHQWAFVALLNAETLHEAIETAEPHVSQVLAQLAVLDEPDGTGPSLVALLIYDTARRELKQLQAGLTTADTTVNERIRALSSMTFRIPESNFDLSVAEELLPWLPRSMNDGQAGQPEAAESHDGATTTDGTAHGSDSHGAG